MADPVATLPRHGQEDIASPRDELNEKQSYGDSSDVIDDAKHGKEVEEFEERLARDEATEEEYLVENAHDVAIKVIPYRTDFFFSFSC
jgi:hypothetical protein